MSQTFTTLQENEVPMSRIVAGMMRLSDWNLTPAELGRWLHACLEMGITTFDHADIYGSYTGETRFGQALAAEPGLRPQMQLVSKCGIQLLSPQRPQTQVHHYDTSTAHILASVETSLRQLHTDYLDVLLIHRPDPLMNADEVAAALTQLRQAGKVRQVGVSNFTPWQFDLLASRLDFPLVTNQVELSLLHLAPLHDGTLDQCQRWRRPPMIWSPLAGGRLLTGDDGRTRRIRATLQAIGSAIAAPLDAVALAWVLAHPSQPVVVMGTRREDRLATAVSATHITLSRQQWFALWEASAGHEVP